MCFMSLVDDVTKYYAERAPVYDETAGYHDPVAEVLRIPIKTRYRKFFRGRNVLEIACGTGYWTPVIGEVAASVLAIDINPALISMAKDRCKNLSNVNFQIANAYTLDGVHRGFDAAYGFFWWSHVPKEQLQTFLMALHDKLLPGALVMFVDQLRYEERVRKQDNEGNTLEQRVLPDGRSFMVVKNFPNKQEVTNILVDMADDIQYTERPEEKNWEVVYKTRKTR